MTQAVLAGVDGCPGGWIAVAGEGGSLRAEVFGSFAALTASLPGEAIIAVDMPIGLPERGVRSAERAARAHLGERQSSLFSIPPRAAVYAGDYRESCSLSLERTDPPRKVSRQAFGLFLRSASWTLCCEAMPHWRRASLNRIRNWLLPR